jgi:small subunit ribosomal protein S16
MLMIRLSRIGKKKQPSYRLIISEKTKDPWGEALEILGFYNPRTEPPTVNFKKERIKHWLSKGAQISVTVHNLLASEKIIDSPKIKVSKIKNSKKETKQKMVKESTENQAG